MQYGLDHYEIRDVWSEVSTDSVLVLEGVPETGNLTDKVTVKTGIDIPEEEKTISLLLAPWEEVEVQLQIQKTIHAPVEKGTCVGAVEYRLGSMIFKTDSGGDRGIGTAGGFPVVPSQCVVKISWKCRHF